MNGNPITSVEVQRHEHLDLSDQQAIAGVVNTYEVRRDGIPMGTVRHRYGDKAPRLSALALALIADLDGCDCGHAGLALGFHGDCAAAKAWREKGSR